MLNPRVFVRLFSDLAILKILTFELAIDLLAAIALLGGMMAFTIDIGFSQNGYRMTEEAKSRIEALDRRIDSIDQWRSVHEQEQARALLELVKQTSALQATTETNSRLLISLVIAMVLLVVQSVRQHLRGQPRIQFDGRDNE